MMNKQQYILKRYKPGTGFAIKQYEKLENDIWNGLVTGENIDCHSLVNALIDYVYDNETSKKPNNQWITKQIKITKPITWIGKKVTITDFEPGTGRSSTQFFQIVKAMTEGIVTCQNISSQSIIDMIKTYVFDQME